MLILRLPLSNTALSSLSTPPSDSLKSDTSLPAPPTFQELKHQTEVMLNIVHCSPVTTAVIRRPDSKYQLGFCVENGVVSAVGWEQSQAWAARGFFHLPGCACAEKPSALIASEVSRGSVPWWKVPHCSPAVLLFGFVSLAFLNCLLWGWWFPPGSLGVSLVTFAAVLAGGAGFRAVVVHGRGVRAQLGSHGRSLLPRSAA